MWLGADGQLVEKRRLPATTEIVPRPTRDKPANESMDTMTNRQQRTNMMNCTI
jgi:hypothetical protein